MVWHERRGVEDGAKVIGAVAGETTELDDNLPDKWECHYCCLCLSMP